MANSSDSDDKGARFSPCKTNSRVKCAALRCKSYANKDPTIRFHELPNKSETVAIVNKLNNTEIVNRRNVWMNRLKIDKYAKSVSVCSLHFTKEDYKEKSQLYPSKKNCLKKGVVPSVNLPTDTPKTLQKKKAALIRSKRIQNRNTKKDQSEFSQIEKNIISESMEIHVENVTNDEMVNSVNKLVDIDCNATEDVVNFFDSTTTCVDKSVQVQLERYKYFIRNDKDLTSMTGLKSFQLLDMLEMLVRCVVPKIDLCYCKESSLSIKDRIVLTFVKLKHNLEYTVLSEFFNVHCEWTCRAIFLRMLDILSAVLQFAIHWPDKQEILKNIPTCFKDFSNVRCVIDGIEIFIQKPNKVCCQSACYSSYKSSYTIKFITAVSPGGLITFISEAYPGRTSDKAVFEQSRLIEKLDKDDALMADKGFLIDDTCLRYGIQLIRPPFLRNKKQFSKNEALSNAKIAKARVHIERANQRIKVFKILSTHLPVYLISKIDQIFLIICAIVNLSEPILKDNKFIEK